MQILFVSVYGEVGVGLKGNVEPLRALIEAVRASGLPFCIAGDWNIEAGLFGADSFLRHGFLNALHAEVVRVEQP
eukprot:5522307-Pyramimonas_sp.AAC.1